ncbi:helix-turn-helix domain-containing protein [Hanstruepera marina]|uniref:helix-turn-helix domain-containing protein n=1 Tax=Hanstruepera marina TaxID=2873265 RepID=UPI001CA7A1F0|nr:AraC family transcriptional regulator [Hanstruepera marina]
MKDLTFDNLISVIIVFISWILILFLLTIKTKKRLSNFLLIAFLLVNAQDSSGLFASFFVYPKYPGLGMLINNTVFFKLPLLYLYLLSVIYSDFKLKPKHLLHLWGFVINFIILWPDYFSVDSEGKRNFLQANAEGHELLAIKLSYILVHIQIALYGVLCFLLIRKYKRLLLENFSNASLFNYKWLFQLVGLLMLDALIATFKNIFMFMHIQEAYDYTYFVTSMLTLGLISWMVLKALHNPELFRGVKSDLQLIKNIASEQVISASENKAVEETKEIIRLKTYMKTNEPFLNPSLSVEELASQINVPTKELSILINHDLNQHFFDFVNSYRIEKAKELLISPEKKDFTILEILYEVGFNSKSSFNTAFKKYTGKTPTEYRKTRLKSGA